MTCPIVNVLKQVTVDGLVVSEVQSAIGQGLVGPRTGYLGFKSVELCLAARSSLFTRTVELS
jgi:hypothetical protein